MLLPPEPSLIALIVSALVATAPSGTASPGLRGDAVPHATSALAAAAVPLTAPAEARTMSPTAWVAPLTGLLAVTRRFDPGAFDWLPGHRGVDLAAVRGSVVHAAGPGVVTWASPIAGRGVVVIAHPDGRRTTYEPVDSLVHVGERVAAGDTIGVVVSGAGHCGGTSPCLHWGLLRDQTYLDPMRLLDPREPVLLPLGAG